MILRKIFTLTLFIIFSLPAFASNEDNILRITPLMSAVVDGDEKGVEFFTKFASENINQRNIGGATAISLASRSNNVKIVALLIAANADVNTIDNEGWTPLMRAALDGNVKIVKILLDNYANVTKLNKLRESAIIQAANSDCTSCLELILAKFDLYHDKTALLAKSQLADAFLIARNKENLPMQNLISSYLDKIVANEQGALKNKSFKVKDIKSRAINRGFEDKRQAKPRFKFKKGKVGIYKKNYKAKKLHKTRHKIKKFKLKNSDAINVNPKKLKSVKSNTKPVAKKFILQKKG